MRGEPTVLKWLLLLITLPLLYGLELYYYGLYVFWNALVPRLMIMTATILRLTGLFEVIFVEDRIMFAPLINVRLFRHWPTVWIM